MLITIECNYDSLSNSHLPILIPHFLHTLAECKKNLQTHENETIIIHTFRSLHSILSTSLCIPSEMIASLLQTISLGETCFGWDNYLRLARPEFGDECGNRSSLHSPSPSAITFIRHSYPVGDSLSLVAAALRMYPRADQNGVETVLSFLSSLAKRCTPTMPKIDTISRTIVETVTQKRWEEGRRRKRKVRKKDNKDPT